MTKGDATAPLRLNYQASDYLENNLAPMCLNDQPLPLAHWSYPSIQGTGYPAGSIFVGTFTGIIAADRAWITTACTQPVMFTFNDTQNSFVRGPATAVFSGFILTVTLTTLVKVGYVWGLGDFF